MEILEKRKNGNKTELDLRMSNSDRLYILKLIKADVGRVESMGISQINYRAKPASIKQLEFVYEMREVFST